MSDIMNGVNWLHVNQYFHCDLKPENILRFKEKRLKLWDFGSAQLINSKAALNPYIWTRWYRAPECLLGSKQYNEAIDIFAWGCIFIEFYLKTPIFTGSTSFDQLNQYWKILGTPTNEEWSDGYRLAFEWGYTFPSYPK